MNAITDAAKRLAAQGYAVIRGDHLLHAVEERLRTTGAPMPAAAAAPGLSRLQPYFAYLEEDPYSPGRRFRAYAQCRKIKGSQITYGHFEDYMQTPDYNPDTGGIVRSYPLIDARVTSDPVFNALIEADAALVDAYGRVGDPWQLTVGVHLFRYGASPDRPAYSSPVWLHRDDEDVVFVHLINRSANIIGGDSIIATDARSIERVLTLRAIGDTLVVDHQKFHAVTPIGCEAPEHNGQDASSFRDIILVTFQRRRDS
ncbi:2OG-Fe dioxygenase family protein [Methylobacterium sp. JK268]